MNSVISLTKFKQLRDYRSSHIIAQNQCESLKPTYQTKCVNSQKMIQKYNLVQNQNNIEQEQELNVYKASVDILANINNFILGLNQQNFPQIPQLSENKSDYIEGQSPHVQQKYKGSYLIKSSPDEIFSNESREFQKLQQNNKSQKDQFDNRNSKKIDNNLDFAFQNLSQHEGLIPITTRNKPDTLFIKTCRRLKERIQEISNKKFNQQNSAINRHKREDSKHRRGGYAYDYTGQLIPLRVFPGQAKFKDNIPTITPLQQQQITPIFVNKPFKRNGRIINKTITGQKKQIDLPDYDKSPSVIAETEQKNSQIMVNQSNFYSSIMNNKNVSIKQKFPFEAFKKLTSKYKQQTIKQKQNNQINHSKLRLSQGNSPIKTYRRKKYIYRSNQKIFTNHIVFYKAFQVKINQNHQKNGHDYRLNINSLHNVKKNNQQQLFQEKKKKLNLAKNQKHLNMQNLFGYQQKITSEKKPNYRISCRSIKSINSSQDLAQLAQQKRSIKNQPKNKSKIKITPDVQMRTITANASRKLKRQRR